MNSHNPLHNPDAGNHPLPSDPREIDAVVRAGRRCYEAHPYFVRRYCERGEAFTRTDGGYLVTLADNPQSYVDSQVTWLAGVLASRGIPRWLMEEHLVLLYEELSTAVPESSADYGKLLKAAQVLREARQTWISQTEFDALVSSFESRAAVELRNAGGLLVAAVCDECCGLAEAVPSLIRWLGNPEYFSPKWCDAVADALERTRALATQKRGVAA